FLLPLTPRPPISTLFPYTTLFRSLHSDEVRWNLELSGLCQLNFNPQLNLGQYRIEAGIAGGRLQIGRRITQPVHGGSIEIAGEQDRKSTRLNSSHDQISYAVFCLK